MRFSFVLLAALSGPALAQEGLTQEQALRFAFPAPATIERRTAFLSSNDLARARALAGSDVAMTGAVVTYYVGTLDDERLGVAYFDSHRVRSLREVLMIVVAADHRIDRIEVLHFEEPPEYRPPAGWLDHVEGRVLGDALSLKGAVVPMTGATLTSRAVLHAARRVLAWHEVIQP